MKSNEADTAAPAADITPTKVILDASARPGLRACGGYLVGKVHTVPKHEADRLIAAKGFRLAKPADDKPATTTDKD